jgi:hypothetical protein
MGGIFINYRKGPHTGQVEALHDRLAEHFGADQVFLDLSMHPGARYPDELRARVAVCEVFLAIIHPGWSTDADATGRPRITLEDDWVRKEIALALEHGRTVIPVLLGKAALPRREDLPGSIREMPMRQRMQIAQGRWRHDVNRLITELEQYVSAWTPPLPATPNGRPRRWPAVALITAGAALVALLPWFPDTEAAELAIWSVLGMVIWLLSDALPALARRHVVALERATHPIPAARYNSRLGVPLGLTWLGMCDAILIKDDSPWLWTGGVTVFCVVCMITVAYRSEASDDAADANWPQLPDDSSPRALRRTVARLARRLREWQPPLSRQQRDQAGWILQYLSDASARLRADADRGRLTWLRTDHPRAATTNLLWLAGTAALALSAAHGLRGYLGAGAVIGIAGLVTAAHGEMTYRVDRWRRRTFATELDNQLSSLRQLVHNEP